VVDSDHRSWAVPNLYVADGSVFVTQGSANPALTIMALASRLAERIAAGRALPEASRAVARSRTLRGSPDRTAPARR
jgi:choline dehydrogenase-like flavoprotein